MQQTPRLSAPGDVHYPGHTQSRRTFLKRAFFVAGGLSTLGTASGFVRYAAASPTPFVIDPDQVPQAGSDPVFFAAGRFYLVNLAPGEGGGGCTSGSYRCNENGCRPEPEPCPELIAGSATGGLLALESLCRSYHWNRNTIRWNTDVTFARLKRVYGARFGGDSWFACPICDSIYTKAGVWTGWLAYTSMNVLPISVRENGSILVDTGQPRWGATREEVAKVRKVDDLVRLVPYPA